MKHYLRWRDRYLRDPSQHKAVEFGEGPSTRDIIICGIAAFCLTVCLGVIACLLH